MLCSATSVPTAAERDAALYRGGLEIHTTLTPYLQTKAEEAQDVLPANAAGLRRRDRVARHPDRRDRGDGRRPRLRPGESEVNMALAPRQTGSSQKMFILAAALQAGRDPGGHHRRAPAVRAAEPGRPERSVRDHATP